MQTLFTPRNLYGRNPQIPVYGTETQENSRIDEQTSSRNPQIPVYGTETKECQIPSHSADSGRNPQIPVYGTETIALPESRCP